MEYEIKYTILTLEDGNAYRIALCQNRFFFYLFDFVKIRTHDPSTIDQVTLPPSVRVERCPSRPNRTLRSSAKTEIMKSLFTCLPHEGRGRHCRLPIRIESIHNGYQATKFEPNPFIRLVCTLGYNFFQEFARSHVARAICNR